MGVTAPSRGAAGGREKALGARGVRGAGAAWLVSGLRPAAARREVGRSPFAAWAAAALCAWTRVFLFPSKEQSRLRACPGCSRLGRTRSPSAGAPHRHPAAAYAPAWPLPLQGGYRYPSSLVTKMVTVDHPPPSLKAAFAWVFGVSRRAVRFRKRLRFLPWLLHWRSALQHLLPSMSYSSPEADF